jgi:hypothetical protein
MKFYKAYYDSRNFSFEAYGKTQAIAKATLLDGLQKHGKQYSLAPDWYLYNGVDDIYFEELKLNATFRDRSEI